MMARPSSPNSTASLRHTARLCPRRTRSERSWLRALNALGAGLASTGSSLAAWAAGDVWVDVTLSRMWGAAIRQDWAKTWATQ
jgi:hypothetical protein